MLKNRLLIATHNIAKLTEMREHLGEIPYNIVSLSDVGIDYDVEETGTTFEENAVLKAKTYSRLSGLLTLADDSGLEIEALNGEPGIHSNRYAGSHATDEDKVEYLLKKMAHVPEGRRQAQFTVYMVLAWPTEKLHKVVTHYTGTITSAPRGKFIKNFPYRVVFVPTGSHQTLAELIEQGIPRETPRTKAIELIKNFLREEC